MIRTDQDGRLRFTKEQRRVLLEAFEGSGQTASRFAAQHGIRYTTFTGWIQQKRKASKPNAGLSAAAPPAKPLLLAEVSCEDDCPTARSMPGIGGVFAGRHEAGVGGIAQVPLAAALIRELARPC